MFAVLATSFGHPEVLTTVELPTPAPKPGEVAIDVTHAAVGLIDLYFRQGQFRDQPGMPRPPFVPGLEVAGTIRELGAGVSGFEVGERVVSMSTRGGTGGYASVFIAPASGIVSINSSGLDSALAVSAIPNAAMAHVALTRIGHLEPGQRVLVHGALGGFAAAFPGIARQLGASRVVGTVRTDRLAAAVGTKLPYDLIVDSTRLGEELLGEHFDVIVDPVGGELRTQSLAMLAPGGTLIASGNASGDWEHQLDSTQLWLRSVAVAGFNAGAYLSAHPDAVGPALAAALKAVTAGLSEIDVEVLSFAEAGMAHKRMESREVNGRIVLTPTL